MYIAILTPSSLDLMNTRDEVLEALAKDVEIHILNDGFRQGIEMYFASLIRQSTLALELASIGSNTEAQANLAVAKIERKTLIKNLDQVYDEVASIDNDLTSAHEELMRVQARIEALKVTREVRTA